MSGETRDIVDKIEAIALNKSPGVEVKSVGDRHILFDAIAEIKRLREALAGARAAAIEECIAIADFWEDETGGGVANDIRELLASTRGE